MQEIVENHGQKCYFLTGGHCFIKCIEYFSKKDYTEDILTFMQSEKYRSGVMTSARIQPFCRKYNFFNGCFDGTRINRRNIARRNTSLFKHTNRFCLIWKSNGNNFSQAKEVLKNNFKVVDNFISDKHVKSFFEKECQP